MSDIDRLTIVVASLGLLILNRLPEHDSSKWSFAHLTFDLAASFVLVLGVIGPVLVILGVWR